MTADMGPVPESRWRRAVKRTPDVQANARRMCKLVGHTLHRGWCLVCHEVPGELPVPQTVLPPKEAAAKP